MLDYHGHIGLQYNPIAIAQYGLGNYNLLRSGDRATRSPQKFLAASRTGAQHLAEESRTASGSGTHHFDWEYRDTLKAPWYSGLAQGQGISLLVRAHHATRDPKYDVAARRSFESFTRSVDEGGVLFRMSVAMSGSRSTWSIPPRTSSMELSGRVGSARLRASHRRSHPRRTVRQTSCVRSQRNLVKIRCRLLVVLRAVGNSTEDGGESLLPSACTSCSCASCTR